MISTLCSIPFFKIISESDDKYILSMNLDFFAFRIANSNNNKLFIFLKFLFLRP